MPARAGVLPNGPGIVVHVGSGSEEFTPGYSEVLLERDV